MTKTKYSYQQSFSLKADKCNTTMSKEPATKKGWYLKMLDKQTHDESFKFYYTTQIVSKFHF